MEKILGLNAKAFESLKAMMFLVQNDPAFRPS